MEKIRAQLVGPPAQGWCPDAFTTFAGYSSSSHLRSNVDNPAASVFDGLGLIFGCLLVWPQATEDELKAVRGAETQIIGTVVFVVD